MADGTSTFGAAGEASGGARTATKDCFQAIIAEAEEGVIVLRPDGVIGYANPAAEFLLGQAGRELAGEMFGLPLAPSECPTTVNVVSPDEQVRTVELRIEPLPSSPEGTLVLRLRDTTAHHRDLAQARHEVRRRDEFLAMLSHELRNPLAAIQNAAMVLTMDEIDSTTRREAGAVLERQFKHLTRILDDLLDIARIARGKLALVQERVDLNQVLGDAVEAVLPAMTKREHAFEVSLPEQQVWVWGDATRLEQIVVNLLNNAAKFTPPKGEIRLAATLRDDQVEICVRDNGPGIPDELLSKIFDPFVQANQTLDRSEGGLGIGLMLVRTFVQLHDGKIEVGANHNAPGVTFSVRLPRLVEGAAAGEARMQTASSERKLRVAVVEDNEDGRRMLTLVLGKEGYEVLQAADGPAGLALILDQHPDVALIDIGLPGLDGYEIARRVRQDPAAAHCRLVAMTGYGTDEDVKDARAAGFEQHMVKPVQYPKLRAMLLEFLQDGRKAAERECGQSGR